jgi:hypothetical protein
MPRIVPSHVVAFIASIPRYNENLVRMNGLGAPALSATLTLVQQVPDELLAMDSATYSTFVYAQEQIKEILAVWNANQTANQKLSNFQFPIDRNPLVRLHDALAKCPDQMPSPSTAELTFVLDAALRANLRNDIGTINRSLSNGEWKAATVLAGSTIEALLLWSLQQALPAQVTTAVSSLKTAGQLIGKQASGPPEDWNLNEYIAVTEQLGIIKKETALQSKLAKDFRNLIHPGRAQRLAQQCDRAIALSAVAGVEHVVRDLTP